MSTAIITGASAGLGAEFAKQVKTYFPGVSRLWLIARSREKLEALARSIPDVESAVLPLDLCDRSSFDALAEKLSNEKPSVSLLINNAGCGYLGSVGQGGLHRQLRMTDLNVTALTAVTHITLPFIPRGGRIINVSSIASFCPNPRMTVYSSTKAYISSFSRGLACEAQSSHISVTAVCPGPMNTDFLRVGNIAGNSITFKLLPYCDPANTAAGALAAARAGQSVYTPTAFYKLYRALAKIIPHSLLVNFTKC